MTLLFSSAPALAAKTILVFGDSLSAGYGIRADAAWPTLLQARLKEQRLDYNVVNASISGETSAGGRSRLPEALRRHRPAIVVIELGANDGLRGLSLAQLRTNLENMITAAQKAGAKPMLVGMRLPPNYGIYAEDFAKLFSEVSRAKKVPLVDFLFAGFADRPELFQSDTVHPTAQAQPRMLENVWPTLSTLLK